MTLQENLDRIASVPLHFAPGSAWRYGVATDVLGAVIEAVAGVSLADAIAAYVTAPLGMRDTRFTVDQPERLATPYADGTPRAVRMTEALLVRDLIFSPARAFDDTSFQSGGGGMVGTAEDFMIFLEALRAEAPRSCSAARSRWRRRTRSGPCASRTTPVGVSASSPASWSTPSGLNGRRSAGTLRWGGVWGNSWFIDVVAGITVVSLSNTALEGQGAFRQQVADAIYGRVSP